MAAVNGERVSELDGDAPESTDFANYFCTYAYIYHQKDMLEDHKRTGAYCRAVMQNRHKFQGKVVLDVGAGSGILAIFAAMAGARKVYAVEATNMAKNASKVVAANKLSDVVEVIQGTIETVQLPEQVDIIISEWMGYFLLRESMLDSVVLARDKFMKPGGAMYPSHARMFLAPVRINAMHQRLTDFQSSMEGWADFIHDIRSYYNVDLDCLSEDYRKEQKEYYMHTSQWVDVHPSQLLGSPACFKSYDLNKVTLKELQAPLKAKCTMHVDGGEVEAIIGFFDVSFRGSEESPADIEVQLSTGPDPTGATHWGQQAFYLYPAIPCGPGDQLKCEVDIVRKKENQRLLEVKMNLKLDGPSPHAQQSLKPRECYFHIE